MKSDPRTKIAMVLIVSSAAVVIKAPKALFLLLLLTLLLCTFLSIPLLRSAVKLRRIWYFFIVLAVVQSIFTPEGETLVAFGDIRLLTSAGLEAGISIMLRMSTIIFSAMIIASAPVLETVYGLMAMKLPYELAFMVLLSAKFLPMFKEEFVDSVTAVQLAGADLTRIPLKKKLTLYTYILMPSVTKALERARYISLSMESRCFRIYPDRTLYRRLQMRPGDYAAIVITFAAAAVILFINYGITG